MILLIFLAIGWVSWCLLKLTQLLALGIVNFIEWALARKEHSNV